VVRPRQRCVVKLREKGGRVRWLARWLPPVWRGLIVLAVGPAHFLGIADQAASVASAVMAAFGSVMSWRAAMRPPPIDPDVLMRRACDAASRRNAMAS